MEGLLRNLRLSEAEKAGLKISGQQMEIADGEKKDPLEPKALAKILSEKLAPADSVRQALGQIWCPIRGIRCKRMEEYEFKAVPIWIRVLMLPLGRMDKATGEMIGEKVGEWLGVDVGEDGFEVGEYLTVKVRIDITKPLMRGMMIKIGDDGRSSENLNKSDKDEEVTSPLKKSDPRTQDGPKRMLEFLALSEEKGAVILHENVEEGSGL
ncbi:hypothetical protein ACQ4PT_053088 [Festuca glaucescens]